MTTTTTTRKAGAKASAKAPAKRPSSAKAPQDRKPPAPKVTDIDGGRLVRMDGIELTIMDEAVDDFELLDLIARAEEEQNAALLPELLRRFVGEEGYMRVMEHLRDPKTRRVSVKSGVEFVNNLMAVLNPNS